LKTISQAGGRGLDSLKKSLMEAEESADFEVEDQSGAASVSFEDQSKFVISPNAPVRQIWISALVPVSSWTGLTPSRISCCPRLEKDSSYW